MRAPLAYCTAMWGSQSWLQAAFQAAGPAGKRVGGLDSPPYKLRHNHHSACRTTLVVSEARATVGGTLGAYRPGRVRVQDHCQSSG